MSGKGKLPKGWRMLPLSDVLDVIESGKRPRGGAGSIEEGVPSIGGEHLTDEGEVVFSPQRYVPLEFYAKISKGRIEKADVLIVKDGATTGKVALVKDSFGFEHAAVNEHVFRLRGKESLLLNEYLYYFLRASVAQSQIKLSIQGSAQPGINTSFPSRVSIPFPPLAVQERIVEVLQQADAIQRKRAEGSRILGKLATPLFEKFFGNLATSRWPTRTVGSVLREHPANGKSPSKRMGLSTADVLTLTAVRGGRLNVEQKKNRKFDQPDLSNFYIKNNDAFVVRGNGNINLLGRMGFYSGPDLDVVYPDTMIRLRFDNSIVADEFIAYLWDTEIIRQQIVRKAKTTSGAHKISQADLVSLEFPCPPLAIQMKFPEVVDQYFESLGGNIAAEDSGASLLNSLVSRAFTGELTAEWEAADADWIAERQTFYERLPRLALLTLLLEQRRHTGRKAMILITALMKYTFLVQMEGELRRWLYRFVPYHYGPCAMELYNDLKALQADGLIAVENDADEDKTRITLTDPARAAALLKEEAMKDDVRLAALEKAGEDSETAADPAMSRLLKRRAETLETIRADAATILDSYGNLDHRALLKMVYEKYPTYAKNSRIRKGRKFTSGK